MRTMSEKLATEKYGKPINEVKSLTESEEIFIWSMALTKANSESQGNNFFESLDRMLSPHGLEVVVVPHKDCCPWFIDKKLKL